MNFLEKLLWRWQGKSKLSAEDIGLKYTGIRKLGEIASPSDFFILMEQINEQNQTLRNAVALSLREIIENTQDLTKITEFQEAVVAKLSEKIDLATRIALIEVTQAFDLSFRQRLLADDIESAQHDLQYAIIKSIEDTKEIEILEQVRKASETSDLVLRRMALQTWYTGLASQTRQQVQEYVTPKLHFLVRAAYELQTDGEFLRKVLSYADRKELPPPKAYPDFMIRYITELLGNWDYDPEAYRSLHAIMVPSYFTFNEEDGEGERPYMIL